MYCSECGAKAAGKFCSQCGAGLLSVVPAEPAVPIDWAQLVDYETIVGIPAVRERIARASAQSKKAMTGEEFLDLYGKAFGKLAGIPVPMTTVAHCAQSLHAKLGIKTAKSRSAVVPTPPGETLAAVLCSLARHGRTLRDVQQLVDGCILMATLPSDVLALEGELMISIARQGAGTVVEARTNIPGQMFDWGKSARCLEGMLNEIATGVSAA
jgi:hypothetical protein